MRLIILLSIMIFNNTTFAATAEEWNELRIKIIKEGHQVRSEEMVGYFLRKGTTFDRTKDRDIEFISIQNNSPYGAAVQINKEKWRHLEGDLWELRSDARIIDYSVPKVINVMSTIFVVVMKDSKITDLVDKKYLPLATYSEDKILEEVDKEIKEWMKLPPET